MLFRSIDNLWDIFEAAIKYDDNPTNENKLKLEYIYDKVIRQKGIRWNITMGLYWIRPNTYINLDSKNRDFIITEKILTKELIQEINEFKTVPSGKQYMQLCDLLLDKIKDGKYGYRNFTELSFLAYTATGYWPPIDEYNPNISTDEWIEFLEEDRKEHPEVLEMLKVMLDLGGEATCKEIGEKLEKNSSTCSNIGKNLGKRAKDRFNLPTYMDGDTERFFIVPFLGRHIHKKGSQLYSWKITKRSRLFFRW